MCVSLTEQNRTEPTVRLNDNSYVLGSCFIYLVSDNKNNKYLEDSISND